MSVWDPIPMPSGDIQRWRVGPLALWLAHRDSEWHLAVQRNAGDACGEGGVPGNALSVTPGEGLPEGEAVRRWAGDEGGEIAQMIPVMPDRPVEARPETPIGIPPGCTARFFVSIPLWIRVCVGADKALTLCEVPSVVLSNIWFGDPMTGELCYSLKTRARRTVKPGDTDVHCAVCPVTIQNVAAEPLDVQRLCIRVAYLAIYEGSEQLWTNGVTVKFQGADQVSQLHYDDKPPPGESVGPLLSAPREVFDRSVLARSLSGFKSLTGLW